MDCPCFARLRRYNWSLVPFAFRFCTIPEAWTVWVDVEVKVGVLVIVTSTRLPNLKHLSQRTWEVPVQSQSVDFCLNESQKSRCVLCPILNATQFITFHHINTTAAHWPPDSLEAVPPVHRLSGIAMMFAGPRTALHIAPSPRACDMQGAPHVSECTWMQIRKLIALSCCIYSNFVQSKWVPFSLVCYMLPDLTAAPSPHFANAYKRRITQTTQHYPSLILVNISDHFPPRDVTSSQLWTKREDHGML